MIDVGQHRASGPLLAGFVVDVERGHTGSVQLDGGDTEQVLACCCAVKQGMRIDLYRAPYHATWHCCGAAESDP